MFKPSTYVNLLSDSGFKAVYADKANKSLLVNLINQILPDTVEKVKDITEYLDRELNSDIAAGMSSRLDLICVTNNGNRVIVEVQRKNYSSFMDRCLYYMSDVYRKQLLAGDDYANLQSVYLISILDYAFPHENEKLWDSDNFISRYSFVETRTGELGSNKFFINFAETKRFTKTLEECKTEKDFLFYWFLHGWEFKKGSTPTEFSTMPRMLELIKASEVAAFSPEKKLKYDNEMMTELDKINYEREQKKLIFNEGHKSGFTEGHESGFTEGITEGKLETARTMKAEGIPTDVIVKCTGIDEETVLNL